METKDPNELAALNRVESPGVTAGEKSCNVILNRTAQKELPSRALFVAIRRSVEALSFRNYERFLDVALLGKPLEGPEGWKTEAAEQHYKGIRSRHLGPFPTVDKYQLLKAATESFLMLNCGIRTEDLLGPRSSVPEEKWKPEYERARLERAGNLEEEWKRYLTQDLTLPYLDLVGKRLGIKPRVSAEAGRSAAAVANEPPVPFEDILADRLHYPCFIELIWSYWQEEGMLVQSMNAISRRFQNIRGAKDPDPLVQLELDPLRSMNSFLWGYVQDEHHRLGLGRRAAEYLHQYGIPLIGTAVPEVRPADTRSKFLESFHNLLRVALKFFAADDDVTVVADGFPVLNALREVHLVLTEGGHNQYGDLPWTARQEMLMQQWLLSRPEMRQFLPHRPMVDLPEAWMPSVEAMKSLQGWTSTSVLHFHNLAVYGEMLLLSIRFGDWIDPHKLPDEAAIWARYFRWALQGYAHDYRAVTGVDLAARTEPLSSDEIAVPPGFHLRRRLQEQRRGRQ